MSADDRSASSGPEAPDERSAERAAAQADTLDAQDRADAERTRERAVTDLTRAQERGSRAAAERLRRERASDDASIRAEREAAERVRGRERGRSLREMAAEREARLSAERARDALRSEREDRARALAAAVAQAREELRSCHVRADQLLSAQDLSPSGEEAVAAIRSSVERLKDLLESLTLGPSEDSEG